MDQSGSGTQERRRVAPGGSIAEALQYVKYKIAVLSGKGGVGKTATTGPSLNGKYSGCGVTSQRAFT